MSYFVAGLWHCAAALAFAATFGVFSARDALFHLRSPFFDVALVLSSSALFFVPDEWAKKGLLKFLHYPLPDWDVLLMGIASHRNWLTHSPSLPLFLLGLSHYAPASWQQWPQLDAISAGLCIGISSHLFWDCVGSRTHKIIVVPHWFHLREVESRLYLLSGAAIAAVCALGFVRGGKEWLEMLQNLWAR